MIDKYEIRSRELYFFSEEDVILAKKYRDIWINSDYPELFRSPSFLEYVNKHEPSNYTLTQEKLNSLFDNYKNEMELQLRKKVNAVRAYKLLMYSSLAIFFMSLFLQSFGLIVFCTIVLAIFNFCRPKDFISQ